MRTVTGAWVASLAEKEPGDKVVTSSTAQTGSLRGKFGSAVVFAGPSCQMSGGAGAGAGAAGDSSSTVLAAWADEVTAWAALNEKLDGEGGLFEAVLLWQVRVRV